MTWLEVGLNRNKHEVDGEASRPDARRGNLFIRFTQGINDSRVPGETGSKMRCFDNEEEARVKRR